MKSLAGSVSDDSREWYGVIAPCADDVRGAGLMGVAGNDFLRGDAVRTISINCVRGPSSSASSPREKIGTTSRNDGHRAAGSFASMRVIAPESSSESSGRLSRIEAGAS